MKRYFQHEAESDLGEGMAYLEFNGEWACRQVEVYGNQWRCADEAHDEWLADQPLEVVGLGAEHEISAEEFERIWREAMRRSPFDS